MKERQLIYDWRSFISFYKLYSCYEPEPVTPLHVK